MVVDRLESRPAQLKQVSTEMLAEVATKQGVMEIALLAAGLLLLALHEWGRWNALRPSR